MPDDAAVDRRLGIVGAGKIGTAIARAAVDAGYDVAISGSGPAERIALIVDVLAPGARALSTAEVVASADLIVLAVPMHRFRAIARDLFVGKILIDAMNYWAETDGVDEELALAEAGTSAVVGEWFSSARVVKSLNHLGYFKFEKGRRRRGSPARLAIAAAGDDRAAVNAVLRLVDTIGFDAVDAGGLEVGLALQPDGPVFGAGYSAGEMSNLLSPEPAPPPIPATAYSQSLYETRGDSPSISTAPVRQHRPREWPIERRPVLGGLHHVYARAA